MPTSGDQATPSQRCTLAPDEASQPAARSPLGSCTRLLTREGSVPSGVQLTPSHRAMRLIAAPPMLVNPPPTIRLPSANGSTHGLPLFNPVAIGSQLLPPQRHSAPVPERESEPKKVQASRSPLGARASCSQYSGMFIGNQPEPFHRLRPTKVVKPTFQVELTTGSPFEATTTARPVGAVPPGNPPPSGCHVEPTRCARQLALTPPICWNRPTA